MMKAMVATLFLIGSAAAIAQAPQQAPARQPPNNDPNQIICVNQTEIGSRLNRRRICRTRAEWAEHERMYRQDIEEAQRNARTFCPNPDLC